MAADQLLFWNDAESGLQILDEPILAGDGTGLAARKMLVVVHQHNAISDLRNARIVVQFIHRHDDVKLQPLRL